jgi:hypothetical protein
MIDIMLLDTLLTDDPLLLTSPLTFGALKLRGGSISAPIKWVKETLRQATVGPLVLPTLLLAVKALIIAFVTAEIMAYLGLIGERGEGLSDWVEDNQELVRNWIHKWGIRPGAWLSHRLQTMLAQYHALPPRVKFASAVTTATTAFPFLCQTLFWIGGITVSVYLTAEFLALIGVLGEVGQGVGEWANSKEAEPVIRTFHRGAEEIRLALRKKLKVQDLVVAIWQGVRDDQVFWIGISVGSLASFLLPLFYA